MTGISHDQLMKLVLQEHLADFVRLFEPEVAAGLDWEAGITFRNAETFTDLPQGALLIPDIVAEVRARDGDTGLIIIHVEIQRERTGDDFARRMWRYYIALALRENKPILPIALLFYPAGSGVGWEAHEEALFGHTIVTFRFLQISLARLAPQVEDYLATGNALAAALASIMGRSLRGAARARLYYACVQLLIEAGRTGMVNRAALDLLGDVVETYLSTGQEDRGELRRRLVADGGDSMALDVTELTWRSRRDLELTFRIRGDDIRRITRLRFGRVADEVEAAIAGAETVEALDSLLDRAVVAKTEDELLTPGS
jgi:hypothetical protein